jgi:hypothetical protein
MRERITFCDWASPAVVLGLQAGRVIRFVKSVFVRIDILAIVRALAASQNALQQTPARRLFVRVLIRVRGLLRRITNLGAILTLRDRRKVFNCGHATLTTAEFGWWRRIEAVRICASCIDMFWHGLLLRTLR